MLPPHIITALLKWALVTKEKMASPLDYDPTLPQYRSEQPRDKAFEVNCNAFSSKFTGFSICHLSYHGNTMYLATGMQLCFPLHRGNSYLHVPSLLE